MPAPRPASKRAATPPARPEGPRPIAPARLKHGRPEMRRHVLRYRGPLTSRPDGTSWPRHRDTFRNAAGVADGLLLPGKRKNADGLAARVGRGPDAVERFLRESPRDPDAVLRQLAEDLPAAYRDGPGFLVLDEVSEPADGDGVGVSRQYLGCLGKIDSGRVAVNLVYVRAGPRRNADQRTWPLGTRLVIPRARRGDAPRLDAQGVPDAARTQTKGDVALGLLRAARGRNLPEGATALGDCEYGDNKDLRAQLRAWGTPYALAVTPTEPRLVPAACPRRPRGRADPRARTPAEIAADPDAAWARVRRAEGTKGDRAPLEGDFRAVRVREAAGAAPKVPDEPGEPAPPEVAWLLLHRDPARGVRAWLCWHPDDAPDPANAPDPAWEHAPREVVERLAAQAGGRWPVEMFHRDIKQLLGYGAFEGRTWQGWHHHAAMVFLAYAFLAALRAGHDEAPGPLPTLQDALRDVVRADAARTLQHEHGMDPETARAVAETVVRRYTDWG